MRGKFRHRRNPGRIHFRARPHHYLPEKDQNLSLSLSLSIFIYSITKGSNVVLAKICYFVKVTKIYMVLPRPFTF